LSWVHLTIPEDVHDLSDVDRRLVVTVVDSAFPKICRQKSNCRLGEVREITGYLLQGIDRPKPKLQFLVRKLANGSIEQFCHVIASREIGLF
jgi:hypothetical protein